MSDFDLPAELAETHCVKVLTSGGNFYIRYADLPRFIGGCCSAINRIEVIQEPLLACVYIEMESEFEWGNFQKNYLMNVLGVHYMDSLVGAVSLTLAERYRQWVGFKVMPLLALQDHLTKMIKSAPCKAWFYAKLDDFSLRIEKGWAGITGTKATHVLVDEFGLPSANKAPGPIITNSKDAEQPKIGSQQASPTLIAGMGVMNYGQSPYLALGEGDVLLGEIRLGTLNTEPCEANYMWGADVAAALHIAKQSDPRRPVASISYPSKNPSPVTGKANNQLPPPEQPLEPPSKPTRKSISDVTRGFCR